MQLEPKYTASVTLTGPDGGTIALALLPFFRGDQGPAGAAGEGVPIGGTAGQVLAKLDATDYNTTWVDQSGGVGVAAWGSITGVLSDQTDLQSELDGKASTVHTHTLAQITDFSAGDYATAAQGILADTAVQPLDDASTLGSGAAADGLVLTSDGVGGAAWEAASGGGGSYVETGPARAYFFDDMFYGSLNGAIDSTWFMKSSGSGASQSEFAASTSYSGGAGWVSFALGTTAAGRTFRTTNETSTNVTGPFRLSDTTLAKYGARVRVNTLSNGTNTFTDVFGFTNSTTGISSNGVFFKYTDSENGGRFQAVTRENGVETSADTGVTVASNTIYKFEIEVTPATPEVVFKIDGSVVATVTTNIPNSIIGTLGAGMGAFRSAGTASVTAFVADYQYIDLTFTGRA